MTETEILKRSYQNGGNNYVLLGNRRWVAFTKNVIINKLISKYGDNFNLVVYWHNNSDVEDVDFICVPYSAVSHLLIDEHLTGRDTPRERWNFIIKDNLFCVHANTNFSIEISQYVNHMSEVVAIPSTEMMAAEEGRRKYILHKSFERNTTLVDNLKARKLQIDPLLHCEICGFSFIDKYGSIGYGFIEAHHKMPLSTLDESTITCEDDLALVCSNCHRMLHRSNPTMTIQELTSRIKD